jgi:hypothetical protein
LATGESALFIYGEAHKVDIDSTLTAEAKLSRKCRVIASECTLFRHYMKVLSSKKEDWDGLHGVLKSVPKSVPEAMANAASEVSIGGESKEEE